MQRKAPICIPNIDQTWCWTNGCVQDGEIIALRKNILIKSTGKNKLVQKTSLKKRSGTLDIEKQHNNPTFNQQTIVDIPLVKQTSTQQRFPHGNTQINFQKPQTLPNYQTNFTPQKTHTKVKFVYTSLNKQTNKNTTKQDQNTILNTIPKITNQIQSKQQHIHFTHSKQLSKSTQITSQQKSSPYNSPGYPQSFKMNSSPLISSQRVQSSKPLISLSSHKKTVMSIDAESQSMESFALFNLEDQIPFTKSTSNVQRFRERNRKSNWSFGVAGNGGSMRSSINF